MTPQDVDRRETRFRHRAATVMRGVEDVLYIAVAAVLAIAGLILFGNGIYAFLTVGLTWFSFWWIRRRLS